MSSKRPPTAEAPKPPTTLHPTTTISPLAVLTGTHPVTLGENTILHPYSITTSTTGPITLGRNCTLAEMSVISASSSNPTTIGDNVTIGPATHITGANIGEGSVIEGRVTIAEGAVLGKFCKITAGEVVHPGEVLPDFTVVYGDGKRKVNRTMEGSVEVREARRKGVEGECALARRLIPNAAAKWG
ncbi:uncharacterized protein MYCGRDRAFT_38720 [Zymoseptoria tritici IPO323]|uniref:Dynactin subunit 6 n=1 Tax=Zymoseptoria tritici (strain CBS 115943 / IPO323) TaxID=336722 RepID=F9X522_ZYMTI|nr:uncharacterized protein MYCGRDRAFT_38720 [Zymoseptoria tritici IPO323]EGP88808.1 hypothetical protein MYCGRDRAFT_38720 [Zymoseptoria tritici IPO323]